MAESMVSVDRKSLREVLVNKIKSEKEDMILEQQVDSISKLRRPRTLLAYTKGFTRTRNSKREEQHRLDRDEIFGCRSRPSGLVDDTWKLIETSPFKVDPKCVAQTRAENLSYAPDSNPDGNTSRYGVFVSFRWIQAPRDLDVSRNHYRSMIGDRYSSIPKINVNDGFDVRDITLDILSGSAPGNEKEKCKEISSKEGSSRAKKLYNQIDQGDFREYPHAPACKSSTWLSTNGNMCVKNLNYVFMLISLFILATLNPPSGGSLEGIFHGMGYSKGEFVNKPIVIRSAVSVAWIVSIISLISELQRDPHLLLSLAAIFLGYVGTILAIESPEALPMLKLGGLVLLLAAFMYLAFNRFPLRLWKWVCGRRCSKVDQPKSVNFKTVIATDANV